MYKVQFCFYYPAFHILWLGLECNPMPVEGLFETLKREKRERKMGYWNGEVSERKEWKDKED